MPQQNTPFFAKIFIAILKTKLGLFSSSFFGVWGVVVVLFVVVVLCFVVV